MDEDLSEFLDISHKLYRTMLTRPKSLDYVRPQIDNPYDLSEVDYVQAIDDSGSIGPLLTKKGTPSLENDATVLIFCFGLPVEHLDNFNADWTDLREAIREDLRLPFAPAIHARMMYGRRVDPKYRGRPNPYANVPFDKRTAWLNAAMHIISAYGNLESPCLEQSYIVGRAKIFDDFIEVMTQCKLWHDVNYLASKKNSRPLKLTTQRLSSPLPPLIALMLGLVDLGLEYLGNKRAAILFDPFDDSQGVAEDTVKQIITETFDFRRISRMERILSSDDIPIAQAADILAFWMRRLDQGVRGEIEMDTNVEPAMITAHPALIAANQDWDRTTFATDLRARLVVQYAIFYEAIKVLDVSFYQTLVSPKGFHDRVEANRVNQSRVSIFLDVNLSAHHKGESPT